MGSPAFFTNHQLPHTEAYAAQLIAASTAHSKPNPSGQYVGWVNKLIAGLIADGNWYVLDRFWVFATEQQVHAVVSIVNPNGLNQSWSAGSGLNVSEVGIAWHPSSGYQGNGTSTYLNTNYAPSTNGVNIKLDNISIGVFCSSGSMPPSAPPYGTIGAQTQDLTGWVSPTELDVYMELTSGVGTGTLTSPVGLLWGLKNSSGSAAACFNGTASTASGTDTAGLATQDLYIFYTNGFYSPLRYALAFVGAAVSVTQFNKRIQTFATDLSF